MNILCPVSPGELIDKITILNIKTRRINDPQKVTNVRHELGILEAELAKIPSSPRLDELTDQLSRVNSDLWDIEDHIRQLEADKCFDHTFIELARSVYVKNDMRAKVKYEINRILHSDIVEEKSYQPY